MVLQERFDAASVDAWHLEFEYVSIHEYKSKYKYECEYKRNEICVYVYTYICI